MNGQPRVHLDRVDRIHRRWRVFREERHPIKRIGVEGATLLGIDIRIDLIGNGGEDLVVLALVLVWLGA